MDDREFFIDHDGLRLHAKLDLPAPMPEKVPILILIHGYTGHMEEAHIRAVARAACGEGFAALRVELYGHGGSDGTFRNHDVMKWVSETLTVVDYARSLDFAGDLYLSGHSQGGLTAMLAAAMERDHIRALIPLSPATVIRDHARQGCQFGVPFDPEHIPDALCMPEGRVLGGNYVRVAQTLPIEHAMAAYRGPVLIVHGDADETVPISYAREAAEQYADARLAVIEGDTHCYDHSLPQVVQIVAAFLRECTG